MQADLKILAPAERGLGGAGQDNGAAINLHQFPQRPQGGLEQFNGQGLRLIQHNHAIGDTVQLAAATGLAGKQGFKQLHIGGHDERRIPVLTAQTALIALPALIVRVKVAVMLQHQFLPQTREYLAVFSRRLVDDAGKGNRHDNPAFVMLCGMTQGKIQARERFAAAGGHAQREETGRR